MTGALTRGHVHTKYMCRTRGSSTTNQRPTNQPRALCPPQFRRKYRHTPVLSGFDSRWEKKSRSTILPRMDSAQGDRSNQENVFAACSFASRLLPWKLPTPIMPKQILGCFPCLWYKSPVSRVSRILLPSVHASHGVANNIKPHPVGPLTMVNDEPLWLVRLNQIGPCPNKQSDCVTCRGYTFSFASCTPCPRTSHRAVP